MKGPWPKAAVFNLVLILYFKFDKKLQMVKKTIVIFLVWLICTYLFFYVSIYSLSTYHSDLH